MLSQQRKPEFVEPNLDVVQTYFAKYGSEPGGWYDYASIKDEADMRFAISKVLSDPRGSRIVRKERGTTTVIFPRPQ